MEGIWLGPLFLRWNGLLIMFGFALGAAHASRMLKRRGAETELIFDLALPLLAWGTLGARLWHVFAPSLSSLQLGLTTGHYLTHPLDLVALWVGGLGLPGAIAGGAFALYLFCRKYDLAFGDWADALAPGVALAQSIGRLGDFFNQQLYGLPTNLPWKIFITPEHRLPAYAGTGYYHPLFAYESILSVLNFALLAWIARRYGQRLAAGDLFLLYLLNYGLIRFFLEFLRVDVAVEAGVNVNQAAMSVVALACAVTLYLRRRIAPKL